MEPIPLQTLLRQRETQRHQASTSQPTLSQPPPTAATLTAPASEPAEYSSPTPEPRCTYGTGGAKPPQASDEYRAGTSRNRSPTEDRTPDHDNTDEEDPIDLAPDNDADASGYSPAPSDQPDDSGPANNTPAGDAASESPVLTPPSSGAYPILTTPVDTNTREADDEILRYKDRISTQNTTIEFAKQQIRAKDQHLLRTMSTIDQLKDQLAATKSKLRAANKKLRTIAHLAAEDDR